MKGLDGKDVAASECIRRRDDRSGKRRQRDDVHGDDSGATSDWDIGTGDWGLDREAISAEETSSAVMASQPSPQSLVPSPSAFDDDGRAHDIPTLLSR